MNNKIHVPKQFIVAFNAFKDTEDFYDLAAQSVGSKILYAFLTAFLCCLLSYGITTFKIANDDDLAGYINAIPEFTYANGQLKLDQTYSNDDRESEVYIYGNTDWESIYLQSNSSAPTQNAIALDNQLQQLISSNQYKKFLIFSKTNFMIVDLEKVQGNYQEMSYADMASLFKVYSLTKSDIMNGYKGVIYKFGGIIGLIMLPVLTIGMFFISLLLSLVGLIVSNVTNNKEDFNTIYWITFYIYSCMALMSNFANAVFNHGFKISLFIFYIYMIKRILDRGEMGLEVLNYNSAPTSSGYGVIDNDYDAFMNNTQPTQSAINKPDTASQKPIVPDSISMNTSGNLNRNTSDSFNMNTSNDTNIDSYYGNTNGSTNTTSTDNTNNSSSDFSFSLKGYEPTDNKNI